MLAIARAMVEPRRLLLIDEPSKGLAPAIVQNLISALRELKRTETTVLLVEQNFAVAKALGDRVAVMDDGRVVHRGDMASWPRTRPCSTGCSASRWPPTNETGVSELPAAPPRRPPAAAEALPKSRFDFLPLVLLAALALAAWPLVGSSSTWVTLTFAGLAMGMIVFITASGLTLVFGLMDVLNFGHSLFIALGAYIATSVFAATLGWTSVASLAPTLAAVGLAMLAAMLLGGVSGSASSGSSSARSTAST